MSTLRATNLKGGSAGSAPNLPDGAVATGVITATSFSGSGANLTGIDATALKDGGGTVRVQANTDGAVVTGILTAPTVSGTTGSFTGNVSVGGTLTYEDVTNVDSIGVITARNGINVTGGVITGDGSGLTNLDASPKISSNAAENINAGSGVVINSSGQIAGITSSTAPIVPNGDGSGLFTGTTLTGDGIYTVATNDSNGHYRDIVHDPDNGITLVQRRVAGGQLKCQAFKLSSDGKTWTAGAQFEITGGSNSFSSICHVGQGKFVSVFRDPNGYMLYTVLIVNSGTLAVTKGNTEYVGGSAVTISGDTSQRYQTRCIWHPPSNKIIFLYVLSGQTYYRAYYGTMNYSSNVVDTWHNTNYNVFGTTETFIVNRSPALAYDPDTEKIIFYAFYNGSTASASAIALTINSNDITLGTRYEVQQGSGIASNNMSVGYDTLRNKVVFNWKGSNNNWMMRIANVASNGDMTTVDGDTVKTGQSSGHCQYATMTCVGDGLIAFIWSDNQFGNMHIKIGEIRSNNTLHIGSSGEGELTFSGTLEPRSSVYDTVAKRVVVIFYGSDQDTYMQSSAVSTVESNSNGYVGIANTTVTSGQSLVVRTFGGTTSTFTGLSTGSTYFVQSNGTFATTADATVSANPSVVGGIALNGTTMLVKS
tara:strand:- start:1358 stop:3307 length:1950 start_codon:yes stop_codon:yes gene_type:complete